MQRGKQKYNIGEVSNISGLSIKSLRYYDKKGILVPSARDESNNYRYYSEEQLLEALAIREMKLRGFTLQEMQAILSAHSLPVINEILDQKTQIIKKEIAQLQRQLQLVENSKDLILRAVPNVKETQPSVKPLEFTVSVMPKMHCVYTRYRSRIYVKEVFWDRFADLYRLMDDGGYTPSGPVSAVFHEHYTRQFFFEDGDLEILQPVGSGDFTRDCVKEFGGFLIASVVYVGFYDELLPAYVALIKWIEDNGYDIDGDCIEEYIVEFSHGVSRSEYVTRVSFPVKEKGAK